MKTPTIEVWLMVNGSLISTEWFENESQAIHYIRDSLKNIEDIPAAGFIIPHNIECYESDECNCIQYLRDHKPVIANKLYWKEFYAYENANSKS